MTRHERKLLPISPPSDRVALDRVATYQGLTFQRERLATIVRELPPLLERHYAEIAVDKDKIPLALDWDKYFDCDLIGVLQIMTVRDGALLAGYLFNFVTPHLMYVSTRWAQVNMYWLDPAYRSGWTGAKLFIENERFLRTVGVQKVLVTAKVHFRNGHGRKLDVFFKRLGYRVTDHCYGKWIGD